MSSSEKDDIVESLFKASNLDESNTGSNSFTSITSSGTKQTAILNKFKSLAKGARDYKKGEAETIKKVLDEIDLISIKRTSEGFNEFNFSIGVFNCVSCVVSVCFVHIICSFIILTSYIYTSSLSRTCSERILKIYG